MADTFIEHPRARKSSEARLDDGAKTLHRTLTWDNWTDFLADVKRGQRHPGMTDKSSSGYASRENPASERWDLNTNWTKAVELAERGWPEGRKLIESLSGAIYDDVSRMVEVQEIRFDVEGECGIDMGRLMEGEPECVMTTQTTEEVREGVGNQLIRVVLNLAASCGVSADVLKARGAATVALVDLLESTGKRCEVWFAVAVQAHHKGSNRLQEIWVQVKKPGESLQIDQVAYALAHPAAFRRLYFAAVEQCAPGWCLGVSPEGFAYGYPCDLATLREPGEIRIEKAFYGDVAWSNPVEARKWVIARLREQGVTVEDKHVAPERDRAPRPRR
jgi:hypothetical protein